MQELSLEDLSQFTNEEVRAVDTAELDKLIQEMREAEEEYDRAKAISSEKNAIREEKRQLVLDTLKACGKSKYHVDGLGTASLVTTMSVNTPKTVEEKRELFKYIRSQHGDDALMALLSINYQSLNSFVRTELETHKDDPAFTVPGVGAPKAETDIRFRSEKPKGKS